MTHSRNPFFRGFRNLRIERKVCIACDDGQPVWRPLHPDQTFWPDDWIRHSQCAYNGDFVVITYKDELKYPLNTELASGMAQFVVYSILDDGQPTYVGDLYSREDAEEIVRHLRFETGFFSRAWEISTAHLTAAGEAFLAELADDALAGHLFVAFRIPGSPAIGVKLIATPWTDAHLQYVEGISADDLRQAHRDAGVPDALADVLHLAGEADVRFLIFDGDASVLAGLPVQDDF